VKHVAALTIGAFVLMIVYSIAKLTVNYPETAGRGLIALWFLFVAYIIGRAYLAVRSAGR